MPVTLESIVPRGDFLEVHFGGAFDGPPFRYPEYLQQILRACDQYHCWHVLLDNTQVEYRTDILVEHTVGESLARIVPPGVRLAFIAPRSTEPHASHFETVAVNRGARVRVFWDRQKALDWLVEASSAAA